MIINWGDAPFKAFITVTYPSGTCTVSLGDKSFTHSGGGTHTFTVNKKGTWTVEAVNGSYSASTTAVITAAGEAKNVALKYELVLWESGNNNTAVTGGWWIDSGYGANAVVSDTTFRVGQSDASASFQVGACVTNNTLDFTEYGGMFGKLCVTMSGGAANATWGLLDYQSYAYANNFHIASVTGAVGTTSLNLANISGSHMIGFRSPPGSVTYITKLWLES